MKVYDDKGNLLEKRVMEAHESSHVSGGSDDIDSALAIAAMANLTNGKIWEGNVSNRPTEIDVPVGVPSGIIAMWHGLIANIPSGWVICDGNNSTPNLLAKFVQGVATAATDPGTTGGEATHVLTESEMPSHTHGYQSLVKATALEYSNDIHSSPGYDSRAESVYQNRTSVATGGGAAHENRPPFYDIAFIMKT